MSHGPGGGGSNLVRPPKVGGPVVPPAAATIWAIFKLGTKVIEHPNTGKKRNQMIATRCKGDADAEGVVAEAWDVKAFKTSDVYARWGAGRYRVEWFNAKAERVNSDIFELNDPKPKKAGARGVALASATEPDDAPAAPSSDGGMPRDPWSLMMLIDQRSEAAAERERVRADAQRERDREFFNTILAAARAPAAAAAAPVVVDTELLRRENALNMREMRLDLMTELRRSIAGLDLGGGGDPDDPDPDPPANLDEGVSRIGMKLLGELEQKAPDLVAELIPNVVAWLKSKGITPSEDLLDEAAAASARARGARPNGAR